MVEFLKAYPLDVFAAAAFGQNDRLINLLNDRPEQGDIRFGDFRPAGGPGSDRDWMTPLGFAIVNRRIDAVRLFLERGADRAIRDVSGRSYRDLAQESGDEVIISLLRRPIA